MTAEEDRRYRDGQTDAKVAAGDIERMIQAYTLGRQHEAAQVAPALAVAVPAEPVKGGAL